MKLTRSKILSARRGPNCRTTAVGFQSCNTVWADRRLWYKPQLRKSVQYWTGL